MATDLSRFMLSVVALVSVLLASGNAYLNFREYSPITDVCKGAPNKIAPWSGELTKVTSMENGTLYTAGSGDDKIYVIHVYGSPYHMGKAHGQLLKPQIQKLFPAFLKHVEDEVEAYIDFLPKELQDIIATAGIDAALYATHLMTMKFTPEYFYDEIRGIADATGLDYQLIVNAHMLPELVKAGCSMLGGWGKSTANGAGFVQLRALDWDTDGPLQESPTVVVYHPDDGNGHSYVNVGWSGWIGTISGISSKGVAVSEKHSDIPFGAESRVGIPFHFLMRDILQYDNSLSDSIRRIQEAHRTCSIWLGVGDANAFRLFEYSESTAKVFDDSNITSINASRYNKEGCGDTCIANYSMKDLVYWGVHLGCWSKELHSAYGHIDAEKVIELVGTVQTGDLQAVVYDMKEMVMYMANAKASEETGPPNAYDRQFVKLDLQELFSEPRPN